MQLERVTRCWREKKNSLNFERRKTSLVGSKYLKQDTIQIQSPGCCEADIADDEEAEWDDGSGPPKKAATCAGKMDNANAVTGITFDGGLINACPANGKA